LFGLDTVTPASAAGVGRLAAEPNCGPQELVTLLQYRWYPENAE